MEEILHQLRLVVYPNIYNVLYIPGGFLAGFVNHQQYGQISPRNHLQEKLTESVDTLTKQGRACPRWRSGKKND